MNSRGHHGIRLTAVFLLSFAAFAQGGPGTRVVVVDVSGTPVNTAWRSTSEDRAPIVHVREIDGNEAAIIDMCFSYVDAQLLYFRSTHTADGKFAFAKRIRSTPGLRDGLYWPLETDGEESFMGPKFAMAAAAELDPADAHPLFGYYFKIVGAPGQEAVGGPRDDRADRLLIAGFALVAWPAEYGVTGVRSFQVNHRGEVYAKDLGAGRDAAVITAFDPDRTWTKVASATDLGEYSDDERPLTDK
jgi:hypothetical protein